MVDLVSLCISSDPQEEADLQGRDLDRVNLRPGAQGSEHTGGALQLHAQQNGCWRATRPLPQLPGGGPAPPQPPSGTPRRLDRNRVWWGHLPSSQCTSYQHRPNPEPGAWSDGGDRLGTSKSQQVLGELSQESQHTRRGLLERVGRDGIHLISLK